MEETFSIMGKLRKSWVSNKNEVDALTSSQKKLAKSFAEIQKEQYDSIKDNNSKIADESISILKKAIETMKDLEIKSIEKRISKENERHDNIISNLDAELKALQDLEDANDYAKDLTKSQQEVNALQSELALWERDDSIEAIAKRAELSKELTEKQESLAEMQHKHSTELRRRDLENQKAIENSKYNNTVNSLEKEKRDREYYWNETLNNEQYFANLRTDIINGNTSKINNALNTYLARFKSTNQQNIQEIGASWTALQSQIEAIQNMQMDLPSIVNPIVNPIVDPIVNPIVDNNGGYKLTNGNTIKYDNGPSGWTEYDSNGNAVRGGTSERNDIVGTNNSSGNNNSNSSSSSNNNSSSSNSSSSSAPTSANTNGTAYKAYMAGTGSYNAMRDEALRGYTTGGETENTELAILHGKVGKPERVLSSDQTLSFNQLVKDLPSLTSVMDNIMKNNPLANIINNFKPINYSNLAFANGTKSGNTNIVNINFDNFRGTVQDQQNVSKVIVNTMKKQGVNL